MHIHIVTNQSTDDLIEIIQSQHFTALIVLGITDTPNGLEDAMILTSEMIENKVEDLLFEAAGKYHNSKYKIIPTHYQCPNI
jgi:hypothetical protein